MESVMLRVVFNPFHGDAVADGRVAEYVNKQIGEFQANPGSMEIVIGVSTILYELRLRVLRGELRHDMLCFVFDNTEILVNEYGKLSAWPEGFADCLDKYLSELVLADIGRNKS